MTSVALHPKINCFSTTLSQISAWVRFWLELQGSNLFYFEPKSMRSANRSDVSIFFDCMLFVIR